MRTILKYRFEILLSVLIGVYIFYFSSLSINRYLGLGSHYFDLGIMNQTAYNTSVGYFLEMTNQDLGKNLSRVAIHFDPIIALFAPFYWFYKGPEVLLVGQTIVVALGALSVYMIAHHILNSKSSSLLFAALYLMYFPVQRANLFDFHPVALATTFLLFAFYFGLVRKHALSFCFVIMALLSKENIGLVTLFYGLYLMFLRKEKKYGLLVAVTSIVFFVTTVFYLIPHARGGEHFGLKYFDDLGPDTVLSRIYNNSNRLYLFRLLFPHALFILFAPFEFLIALPELGINLLSSNNNMKHIFFHYNAVLVPFVFISSIYGLNNLNKVIKKKLLKSLLLIIFVILNLVNIYLYSPIPYQIVKQPHKIRVIDENKLGAIKDWQRQLQDDQIKVATTPRLAPFFTTRRYYYNFLFDPAFPTYGYSQEDILENVGRYEVADYVIVDIKDFESRGWEDLLGAFYSHLKGNPSFKMISKQGDIEVYRKL